MSKSKINQPLRWCDPHSAAIVSAPSDIMRHVNIQSDNAGRERLNRKLAESDEAAIDAFYEMLDSSFFKKLIRRFSKSERDRRKLKKVADEYWRQAQKSILVVESLSQLPSIAQTNWGCAAPKILKAAKKSNPRRKKK